MTVAVPTDRDVIDTPGIYDGIDDVTYHRDPVAAGSLSSSELRRLNECPARFHYYRTSGHKDFTPSFDLGHAAHKLVLGEGAAIFHVDADDWRTKDARAARDEAHAAGHIPMLTKEFFVVEAMAAALRQHPLAAKLIDIDHGLPEQSLFWQEDDVWGRARFDWLPNAHGRRRIIVDYKTAANADPQAFGRSVATYGYHLQRSWYTRGFRAVFADEPAPGFVFVVQEIRAPYLVSVCELDPYAAAIGDAQVERALAVYRRCIEANEWPGYPEIVNPVSLPRWAEMEYEEAS